MANEETFTYEVPPPAAVPGREEFSYEKEVPKVGIPEDIWRSARSAAVTAPFALPGQIGDYRDILGHLADYMTKKSGQEPGPRISSVLDIFPNTADYKRLAGVGDKYDWQSQTLPGAIAGGVTGGTLMAGMGGAPGVVTGATSLPRYAADMFRFGAIPGVTSTLAGQTAKDINPELEPVGELLGGAGGAVVGKKALSPKLNTSPLASSAVHGMHVNLFDRLFEQRGIEKDRKSTRLNSSHSGESRMPSSA